MTVEERAEQTFTEFMKVYKNGCGRVDFNDWTPHLKKHIAQALRDQIEDCAKLIDKRATDWSGHLLIEPMLQEYANGIRALANQTDQTEGKEGER